ncbi:hypothetical protein DQ04_01481090 [Trypanosoma grayi]|uniref:hypothetical protein n=1 Tax=Trypanosoma grayi TaxID=71804 RepID=UPI0004F400B8|nr:hypothetical protein DQ04_01481090 [Trypanosoma grayi]KEG12706.1 hypothetical protein DQ04_01481090 [Trypanosoma grayi]
MRSDSCATCVSCVAQSSSTSLICCACSYIARNGVFFAGAVPPVRRRSTGDATTSSIGTTSGAVVMRFVMSMTVSSNCMHGVPKRNFRDGSSTTSTCAALSGAVCKSQRIIVALRMRLSGSLASRQYGCSSIIVTRVCTARMCSVTTAVRNANVKRGVGSGCCVAGSSSNMTIPSS